MNFKRIEEKMYGSYSDNVSSFPINKFFKICLLGPWQVDLKLNLNFLEKLSFFKTPDPALAAIFSIQFNYN